MSIFYFLSKNYFLLIPILNFVLRLMLTYFNYLNYSNVYIFFHYPTRAIICKTFLSCLLGSYKLINNNDKKCDQEHVIIIFFTLNER